MSERLPAQPLADWLNRRCELFGDAHVAGEFDCDPRVLYRYRNCLAASSRDGKKGDFPTDSYPRDTLEDLFAGSPYMLMDVYPDLDDDVKLEDDAYCPKCREMVTPLEGSCPWCNTAVERERRKRGGWKRPDKTQIYTDAQLRALHVVYERDKVSIRTLAKRTWRRAGYASYGSAANAICKGWKRLGLPVRDRVVQLKLTCTTHGQAPKHRTPAQERAYRRFLQKQRGWRAVHGPGEPRCEGVRQGPPRKGERCQRPAMRGSRYCCQHDPERAAERAARLARMRARRPKAMMMPIAPFAQWLRDKVAEAGSIRAAMRAYGWSEAAYSYVRQMAPSGGPKTHIAVSTVEAWMAAAGCTLADLPDVDDPEVEAA